MIANGIDAMAFEEIVSRIDRWEDWCDAFGVTAERYEAVARTAADEGHAATAAEAWRRAALCWHFGKFVFMDDPVRAQEAQERMTEDYAKGIVSLEPPGEHVLIPYGDVPLAAILRRPPGIERAPVVVMIPGLDSTKEELQATADVFLRRRLATLAVDGPGQGETERLLPIEPHYERPVCAVVDWLQRRSDVDASRIGLYGVSLGGYYVIRAAAFEPRVRAVIDLAGPFDFSAHWASLPPMTRITFQRRAGVATDADACRRAGDITLRGLGARVGQPVLVMHGTDDPLVPFSEATAIAREFPTATLAGYVGGNHGLTDRAFESRARFADWLADRLHGD